MVDESKVTVTNKQVLLLDHLREFYSNLENGQMILSVVKHKETISLRVLDWLATNYSKKFNVSYTIKKPDGKTRDFHLYMSYKCCLRAFSKRQFDPFARRERVTINVLGEPVCTTVAQLCFFKWCITNRVIQYAIDHIDDIEKDMLCSISHRYAYSVTDNRRKKRRELSKNNTYTNVRNDVPFPFAF